MQQRGAKQNDGELVKRAKDEESRIFSKVEALPAGQRKVQYDVEMKKALEAVEQRLRAQKPRPGPAPPANADAKKPVAPAASVKREQGASTSTVQKPQARTEQQQPSPASAASISRQADSNTARGAGSLVGQLNRQLAPVAKQEAAAGGAASSAPTQQQPLKKPREASAPQPVAGERLLKLQDWAKSRAG